MACSKELTSSFAAGKHRIPLEWYFKSPRAKNKFRNIPLLYIKSAKAEKMCSNKHPNNRGSKTDAPSNQYGHTTGQLHVNNNRCDDIPHSMLDEAISDPIIQPNNEFHGNGIYNCVLKNTLIHNKGHNASVRGESHISQEEDKYADKGYTDSSEDDTDSDPVDPQDDSSNSTVALSRKLHAVLDIKPHTRRLQLVLMQIPADVRIEDLTDKCGHTILHNIVLNFKPEFLSIIFYGGYWYDLQYKAVEPGKGSPFVNLTARNISEKQLYKAKGPATRDEYEYFDILANSITQIMKASLLGQSVILQELLSKSSDTDLYKKDVSGFNCFIYAAAAGDLTTCEMLHENNVDSTVTNSRGQTALHIAAKMCRSEVIPFLITHCKVDTTKVDDTSRRAIDYPAINGDFKSIQAFQNCDRQPDELCLIQASKHQQMKMVKYLIMECTLNIHGKDESGRTAFLTACYYENIKLVKYLLSKEANILDEDDHVRNCLHTAVDAGHLEMVQFLVSKASELGYLALLLNKRDKFCGRELVTLVRGRDRGRPAWHYAQVRRTRMHLFSMQLARGSVDVVQFGFIISSGFGVSPDAPEKAFINTVLRDRLTEPAANEDMSPLHIAAFKNNLDILRFLLQAGAEPNQQDHFGSTPLHIAAMRGNMDCCRLLEMFGADLTVRDDDEDTAADVAKINGHTSLENVLRGRDMYPTAQNFVGIATARLTGDLSEETLEQLRQNGDDVRGHCIHALRELSIDINEALLALDSGPVMEETH